MPPIGACARIASSRKMHSSTLPAPAPPNSSATLIPAQPSSAILRYSSCEWFSVPLFVHLSRCSRVPASRRQKSDTALAKSVCSGVKVTIVALLAVKSFVIETLAITYI